MKKVGEKYKAILPPLININSDKLKLIEEHGCRRNKICAYNGWIVKSVQHKKGYPGMRTLMKIGIQPIEKLRRVERSVEDEYILNKRYYDLGIPIAKPTGVAKINEEMFLVEERLPGESFGQQLERPIVKEDFESFRELYIKFEKLYDSFIKILDKHKIIGDVGLFDFFIKKNKLFATDLLFKPCKKCDYLTFKQLAKIELDNKIANEFIEKITTEKIYDTSSNLYFESRWKNCQDIFEKVKQVIIGELQPKQDDKILDVGCGPGTWTQVLKEYSANVAGIDISEEMLKIAKNNVEAKFLQCSGDDTPFERDFFDKIVCVRMFEYFQNKQKAVNEFYRILKHNGRVVIVTKSPYFIIRTFNRIKMVLKDLRWLKRVYDKEYGALYFQEYITPRELENILKRANFKNIKHYPVTYYLDKPRMTTLLEICSKIFSFAYYLFCESYIIVAIKDEKSKKSSHIKQTPK